MIIHYSTKVKKFSKKNIKEYEETYNFRIGECPNPECKSREYIKWGTYTRNIVYYKNGKKHEKTIEIKRIRCKHCKSTHSIIPAFLVPYKVHILEYIIEVIKNKNTCNKTSITSNKYRISRQLIKQWEGCYEKHFSRASVTIESKNRKEIIRRIKKEIYIFIDKYYRENRIVYMMYLNKENKGPILKWAPT